MDERRGLARLCFLMALAVITELAAGLGGEFCAGEAFHAECDEDAVIVMKSAQYGRMRLGRCIQTDLGFLGCSADVLHRMADMCSGRQTCNVPYIVGVLTNENACPKDVNSYLEAAYSCVQVKKLKDSCNLQLNENLDTGYLSNHHSDQPSSCGSKSKPIILDVASTQRIQFTLMDFSLPQSSSLDRHAPSLPPACIEYGYVMDSSGSHELCGGSREVIESSGGRVEVLLKGPAINNGRHFLLQYKVVGCREPAHPPDMWMKRSSHHITLGCYSSRAIWRLECVNGTWHGSIGNCSQVTTVLPPSRNEDNQEMKTRTLIIEGAEVELQNYSSFSSDIILILCVSGGVILSLLLLAVGILFDKSKKNESDHRKIPASMMKNPIFNPRREKQSEVPYHPQSQHSVTVQPSMTCSGPNMDTMHSTTTCTDYDVPHYYELDPNYVDTTAFEASENIRQPLVYQNDANMGKM